MTAEIFVALIPYIISAGMSYAIAAYCWRRRTVAGAAFFAALALCRGLLTTGYIFELLSPTLDGKIFWDDLQFYPSYLASTALLAFVLRHGEYRVRNPRLVWGGLLAIVALFSLATITNPVFHLLRTDASLVPGQPFSVLTYTFTRVYLLYVAYTLILYFASLLLLIVKWFRAPSPFRGQLGAIILGNSIPLAGAVLTRFGVIPAFDRDTTAFWFAVSNAIVWWGMYHYRLFDLAPIAHDKLIEQMNDIVVVVDAENRVVDMNRAAEKLRGATARELIGKPVSEAFPLQLDLINRFVGMGEIDTEINPGGPNAARTFHLTVTPLTGRGDKLIGRLVVAHDITQLKETQAALDTERAKLEKTVARRTAALTKANQMLKEEVAEREEIARDLKDRDERLKRLTDAAFEGIAISENGVFVEINQQLADMLGVEPDEIIGKRIIEFVAPESREDVERRVRLNEETTYDHIALRKDGTKFPAEARSRTLQVKGRKLRMTAIRDMTEQVFAELSVQLSEKRFRLILDNMPILLDAFDGNNRIIVWNKACEDATGYSAEEMLGNPNAMEILYPDPAYREFVWKSAMDPNSTDTTFELTTKSGEKRTIMWFETFRQVDIPGWASWGLGLDVTETRRAEAAERASRVLSDALSDTAGVLTSNLEMDVVLDRVLANVGKSVEHDAADIMLIKDGKAHVVRSMANGMDIKTEGTVYPIKGFPLMAKLIKTNQPLMVEDTREEPLWKQIPENAWIRSMLAAPVRRQGKVIGVINLLKREPHAYGDEHARRLVAFADQAAIAIHNAQLYRTERENRELAEALRDSTAALSSKLSLDEVLDSVFDNLNRVLPHDAANVMLLEEGVVRVVGKRGYTREQDAFLEKMRFPIEERPNLVKMRKTLKPVVVTDTKNNPNWIQHPGFETVHSYVGAPIRVGKNVIGFLNLSSNTPTFFDESVTERLTAFADQAAIAMHNAQLYRTERENRELAEALRDSTAALSGNLSLDEVLKSILDNLERVVPHAAANVMLVEGDTARVVGKRGYTRFNLDDTLEAMRIPIESRHMFAAMFHKLKPAFVSDTRKDPKWVAISGFEWQLSYIGVPIKVGNDVLGFLNLDGSEPGFFDEPVIERLTAFADQAAIAIHNAQLYETERENREMAEALRDSTAALSSKLSLDEVLNSILDNLERVLPHTAANIMLVDGEIARVVGRRGYTQWGLDDVLTKARRRIKDLPNLTAMIETHEPFIIPDTWKFSGWNRAPGFDWLRSYVGAPIIVGGSVIGFLNLDGDRVGFFNESVIERLKAFASQAAIAIYNAQLYRTERENRELAEALRDTTAALSSKLSQEEVLNSILENIGRVLPHDAANVMMIEGGVARIVGKRGYGRWNMDERLEKARYNIHERTHFQQMLTTLKPVIISDTSQSSTWEITGFVHWIRSYAGAPIRVGDEVIGFLNLDAAEPGFFDESTVERLTAFANQAAVALHNARLYETERRERILAQMFQQLTEGVQGATSPSNILTIVLRALVNLVPYQRALIGLLEETGMRVEAEEGVDDHSGLMGKLYLFKENPHLLQILSKGQPALFRPDDMPDSWESLPGIDERAAIWVAMPLTTWDVTTGLLCLTLADAAASNEDIIASVATFSQRARLALENSRLLIELLQSKGDLREAQSYLVRSAELAIAGEIATGVAHQISNPLTSVMAHAHLLLQKVGPDDPLYIYGKAIKEATDRAATVVQRMLDFARAREMDMQPVDLNASLNTAASLVEPQITASARLILNLEPNLPRVIGSREHLEDVWINLLINARDALKQQTDGVITLTSTLDRDDDKSVIIQFQDNGPGIPLDEQGRIFSSFFTTKEEGVGLGLAICYDIIIQHHGSIHVESREGSGAKFIVRLPVGAAAGQS